MPANLISLIVATVSAVGAAIAVIFAWRAARAAERSNTIALIAGLHQLYHSEATFQATQRVWALYRHREGEDADGTPITNQQARQFVAEVDRFSDDWKAVHDAMSFWRYLNLLVNQGFVDESIAFGAFSSPRILGFLYPIENAFVGEGRLAYEESLQSLYERWKARQV